MDKPHKRLIAWQRSMDLVELIYRITKSFPKDEAFGLKSQMRRAAVSAPSNIAEGAAGRSNDQFRNFLSTSIGSLNELSTQLDISARVGYLDSADYQEAVRRTDECIALTFGLRKSLTK